MCFSCLTGRTAARSTLEDGSSCHLSTSVAEDRRGGVFLLSLLATCCVLGT